MKWPNLLILLSLIACGKHEQPKRLDLRDSDGDQVLNYQESELEKYVANFEPLGKVKGVMRFTLDKIIEVPLSNELNIKDSSLSLAVANKDRVSAENYFSEWSKLRLTKTISLPDLKSEQYQLHLQFEDGSAEPEELLLKTESEIINLGAWSNFLKIQISRENFSSLINGKAFFMLKKKFPKSSLFNEAQAGTIKDKTYRVHYFDGKKSRILYVSNELDFSELLRLMDIKARIISEDDLFFNAHIQEKDQWFVRELKDSDKVLVFTNISKLREKFLKNYTYQKKVLSRKNGKAAASIQFKNSEGAKVYLRITSAHFTQRTFVESKERRSHGGGGGGGREGNAESPYKCTHYLRKVKKETVFLSSLENLFQNLGESEALLNSDYEEQLGNNGPYWEMKLNQPAVNLIWIFINRPASTFTKTGEYDNSCRRDRSISYGTSTNYEGKFEVVIESFVEKIGE